MSLAARFGREDSTNQMETTVPTTKRKTTATRRAKAHSTDAIEILMNDHREVEKMFKAFTQLRSTGRHDGTGLGLHLSQKLAELLGGSIGFTSEFGRGSTFILSLPRA